MRLPRGPMPQLHFLAQRSLAARLPSRRQMQAQLVAAHRCRPPLGVVSQQGHPVLHLEQEQLPWKLLQTNVQLLRLKFCYPLSLHLHQHLQVEQASAQEQPKTSRSHVPQVQPQLCLSAQQVVPQHLPS